MARRHRRWIWRLPLPTQPSILLPGSPTGSLADTRPGYSGWLVDKTHLVEFATALRDEFGYDYLSSVTGVDYLPAGKMEVVYQVYRTTGGPGTDVQSTGASHRSG